MGRRPAGGRKYPKHISIQVLEEHNRDLKLLAVKLNKEAPLENKKWGIRDVILTLIYNLEEIDSQWFLDNHFEKLSINKISDFRNIIKASTPRIKVKKDIIRIRKPKIPKKNALSKPKLSIDASINAELLRRKQLLGEI